MHGIRFLSAFLKVNPYFTVVLAVAFTGIAAIGVKQSETVSFKNLIPLHIRSIFSKASPDKIVTAVPGIEDALQRIHELLQWSALPTDNMNLRSTLLASPPVADSDTWENRSLLALTDPIGLALWQILANQPGPRADKAYTSGPYRLHPIPPEAGSGPEVNSLTPSRDFPRFSNSLPISPVIGSQAPEIPIIIAQYPLAPPPPLLVTPPNSKPGHSGGGSSGGGVVPVPEPPAGFLFAGSLVVLGVLYRNRVKCRVARFKG